MDSFYNIYSKLNEFWIKNGVTPIFQYSFCPIGAGTFHPSCFFSSLSNKKSSYCYAQKSTRKADARYGESPNRLLHHHQFQVIFTPAIDNIKELFLKSLEYIGISLKDNFIQFNDNNWENISIGAIGVGWEVLCNNTEICQFTYFQKMADIEPFYNTVELAYGLERLAFVINKKSIFDTCWHNNSTYLNERYEEERQGSIFFLEKNKQKKDDFFILEKEILNLLNEDLYLPAYELLLKMIDMFNSLDAQKDISIFQRKEFIDITRHLSNKIANNYIKTLNSI